MTVVVIVSLIVFVIVSLSVCSRWLKYSPRSVGLAFCCSRCSFASASLFPIVWKIWMGVSMTAWLWSSFRFSLAVSFWYISLACASAMFRAFMALSRGVFCGAPWGGVAAVVLGVGFNSLCVVC